MIERFKPEDGEWRKVRAYGMGEFLVRAPDHNAALLVLSYFSRQPRTLTLGVDPEAQLPFFFDSKPIPGEVSANYNNVYHPDPVVMMATDGGHYPSRIPDNTKPTYNRPPVCTQGTLFDGGAFRRYIDPSQP